MDFEGQQLGEFEILEILGQGGMGAVYKARQTSLDRLVAIKTLKSDVAGDVQYIARFRQEAKAAARLNHPNLVQVYSAGQTEGIFWFAMEYVEGGDLEFGAQVERLRRDGDERFALDLDDRLGLGKHDCVGGGVAACEAELRRRSASVSLASPSQRRSNSFIERLALGFEIQAGRLRHAAALRAALAKMANLQRHLTAQDD